MTDAKNVGGGLVDRIAGKVKQTAGAVLGDDDLAREGRLHEDKADATAEAIRRDELAAQSADEAEVVEREAALLVEEQSLAAEAAEDVRREHLEREHAEEQTRIEREHAAQDGAIARAAHASELGVAKDEAAAARDRDGVQREATALAAEADRARSTAEALERATEDTTGGS